MRLFRCQFSILFGAKVEAEFLFPMGEHYKGQILRFHDETYKFHGFGVRFRLKLNFNNKIY